MREENRRRTFFLPEHLISYETTRSGGPGGQGVNTTDSAVRARVTIWRITTLTHDERRRVVEKMRNHLTQEGELIAKIQTTRSQLENKRRAKARLESLIVQALRIPIIRIPTQPTKHARKKRLEDKKRLDKKRKSAKEYMRSSFMYFYKVRVIPVGGNS